MMDVVSSCKLKDDLSDMITTTNKTSLRRRMLDVCILKQQSLIDDFSTRIRSILQTPGLGNEEAYDNNVLSKQSQHADEIDGLQAALKLATDELNFLLYLTSFAETIHMKAEPGAVVVTDRSTFFVSVSIEEFYVEGSTYVGISTKSPIYKAMCGLGKDQNFTCKGLTYKIVDVF